MTRFDILTVHVYSFTCDYKCLLRDEIYLSFLYKLQQGQNEQNVPLWQVMASVKYLGKTTTATRTYFACVSVAFAALPFLNH